MRVGVFLDKMKPDEGGGFTFTHSVVQAFLKSAATSRHDYILFCAREFAEHVVPSAPSNVRAVALAKRGVLGDGIAKLRHYLPITNFVLRRKGALERAGHAEGVHVMWFVGGFHDTIDIPYISTVWDLQHRTHPWFPEVSEGFLWDHRDLYYSRHLRRAARVITGTEVGRAELERYYGLTPENIRILPHPTPGFALEAAASNTLPARVLDQPYYFYPAQYWAHKNHVNILLAWRRMLDAGEAPPHLIFVGSDKGNRKFVAERVRQLGLECLVHLSGFVSKEELISLYRHADAMIYASFSGPENLPPLEAFAFGCPVIASDFPGAREQLADAALFFDPHDPAAIEGAVRAFRADPRKRAVLIENGRQRAVRSTGDTFLKGVLDILDEFEAERRCWA